MSEIILTVPIVAERLREIAKAVGDCQVTLQINAYADHLDALSATNNYCIHGVPLNVHCKDCYQGSGTNQREMQYDESSDFSASLKNASLAPTGTPELRTGNPFSRKIP